MARSKYAKNIITEDLMPPPPAKAIKLMEEQKQAGKTIDRTLLLGMQDSILKGSFFAGCEWIWGLTGSGPVNTELPHKHDFDEIIGFAGSNKSHPRDLGGEIEWWMGEGKAAEKFILTSTTAIYVPKGLVHGPLIYHRVDRPILNIAIGLNTQEYG